MKTSLVLSFLLTGIFNLPALAQNTNPWSGTSYIGIQIGTGNSPLAPLHVKTNLPLYGVMAIQDHSGSGVTAQPVMSFLGADGNRVGALGPSYNYFLVQNDLNNGAVALSPNGYTTIGGFSNNGNKLQVYGSAYVQTTVGIGTATPNALLEAKGTILSSSWNTNAGVYITGENGNYGSIQATNGNNSAYKNLVLQEYDGNVAIGTNDPKGYRLAVNGPAIFTQAKVKLNSNWPDYVFHSNYRLPSLQDVEAFIKQHHHLPEIPSAKEAEENGIDLGSNQTALLKKIEELTLYLIEMENTIKHQAKRIEQLEQSASKTNGH